MTDLDQKALDAAAIALSGAPFATKNSLARATRTITAYIAALPPSPAVVPEAPLKDDEGHEWPARLSIRDTKLHDDLSGPGQRIYTTAGRGYKSVEYVRADLSASPSPPALDGAGRDAVIEECAKAVRMASEQPIYSGEMRFVAGHRLGVDRSLAAIRALKETP